MERITQINPAYDKRDPDPKKDYGIGAVSLIMVLKGKKGAIHFSFGTGMYLERTQQRLAKEGKLNWEELSPGHWYSVSKGMGYDVGYHSLTPQHDFQKKEGPHWPKKMYKKNPNLPDPGPNATQEERLKYLNNIKWRKIGKKAPNCIWLGKPCYCDGSAMRAEEWFNILKEKGSDVIWKMMETDYKDMFGKLI